MTSKENSVGFFFSPWLPNTKRFVFHCTPWQDLIVYILSGWDRQRSVCGHSPWPVNTVRSVCIYTLWPEKTERSFCIYTPWPNKTDRSVCIHTPWPG